MKLMLCLEKGKEDCNAQSWKNSWLVASTVDMKQEVRALVTSKRMADRLRAWEARENELIQDKLTDMKVQRHQLVKFSVVFKN